MNKKFLVTSFGLLFLIMLLTGCASVPITNSLSWQQQQQNIQQLTIWHAHGKIGCINGNQGGTANIDWQQQGNNYSLILSGPMQVKTIYIKGKPGKVQLTTANNLPQLATNPETLIQQQLGWNIPVTGLIYWARGLPVPNTAIEEIKLNKQHRLSKLQQQGWVISYDNYKDFKTFALPTKISLQYQQIKIKLIFKNWL